MKGLSWDDFHEKARASVCRDCNCGVTSPWRGNSACLQAWLRFHSSRGIILSCNAARSTNGRPRREDSLMSAPLSKSGLELT
ncbi:hypothetical protein ACFL6M_00275 [Candidatus Eisenbacteria bacterium]|uniref:Uncharacterized protein n=1 Tax=Eiseniibacteriota bacterium TaxID=2212470 RepID=A0ABV6YI46_UNCEI